VAVPPTKVGGPARPGAAPPAVVGDRMPTLFDSMAAYAAPAGAVSVILLFGALAWIFFGFAVKHDE
jgi:hypothetical protein